MARQTCTDCGSSEVKKMVDHDAIQYYENEKEFGLRFKNGVDPQVLVDAIKKIDG